MSEEKPDGRQLFYLYDSYGYLTAIRYYNGDTSTLVGYYVTTNAQGDVIGIYNADGALRATYEYDAWGNIISIKDGGGNTVTSDTHIAKLNSIRYRSYCYDNETGLYYVISRYYNPQVGRWLNADALIDQRSTLGMNLFAYCINNPIMLVDSFGLCANAWAAGYNGPCPGQGLPGCMDNWLQVQEKLTTVSTIDPDSPPDHPDYIPPKKGGNNKVKNPNGQGKGWPAKDNGVWIPTPNMHGGEGWTIQYPGGSHSHAYPGGKVRNHFQPEQPTGESLVMVFVGVIATFGLIADDITGVGVANDSLLAGTAACFFGGLNGLCGKQVCTVCGGIKFGY